MDVAGRGADQISRHIHGYCALYTYACIHERLKDCHRIHNHTIKGVKLQMVNKDVLIMDNRRCLSEEASEK